MEQIEMKLSAEKVFEESSNIEAIKIILNMAALTKDNGIKVITDSVFDEVAELISEWIDHKIMTRDKNETGLIKIDVSESKPIKFLNEMEIKKLAARICNVTVERIESGERHQETVCARWLVVYYFDTFTHITRRCQGIMVGKDHSTAVNICAKIDDWTGWRLMNKRKFEAIINSVHRSVGIRKVFK